jgi:hypothetical protein
MSNKILNLLQKSDKLFNYKNFKNIYTNNDEHILNYYKTLVEKSYLKEDTNSSIVPRFLQEFVYMFYLSLKIIKNYYKDNSYIICLGESPAKIILTQSFFYDDIEMKKILEENNYPKNLFFKYLPLSGLGYLARNHFSKNIEFKSLYYKRYLKELIEKIMINLSSDLTLKYYKYLKKYSLDPESIINSDKKNYIFLDRTESFSSITILFVIYKKLIDLQNYNENNIKKFIKKIKIVGFDTEIYSIKKKQKKLVNLKRVFDILFSSHNKNTINFMRIKDIDFKKKIINEIKENFKNNNLNKSNSLMEKGLKLFNENYINFDIPNNLIFFLTIPERIFIDSRCIKSIRIQSNIKTNKIKELNINKIKNEKDSKNCNVCNYIFYKIYLRLKELKQEGQSLLEYLIKNLDYVDINKISYLSKESFDPLLFIDKYINENNIKNEILNNKKYIKNTIFEKDAEYLIPLNIEKKNNILYIDYRILINSTDLYSIYNIKYNYQNMNYNDKLFEEIFKYYFRPGYKDFFLILKKLKDEKKLDKIYIYINKNNNNYLPPNEYTHIVEYMVKYMDKNNIIDNLIQIDLNNINKLNTILNLDIICNENNCDKIYVLTDDNILTLPEKQCIKIKSYNGIKINYEDYKNSIKKYVKNENEKKINTFKKYYNKINKYNKINDNELSRVSKIIEDIFNDKYKNINNNNLEENKNNLIQQNLNNYKLNNILCLDFDETIGSFHINYSQYSIILNKYIEDDNINNEILKELLINYHMRPGLDNFFKELKKMKDNKIINKIFIISRNTLPYHNNYFINTINLIQDIVNCKDLIDDIKTNVKIKNLIKLKKQYNCNKIFIVDDKCEYVIPEEDCISIKPYFVYEDYSIFINILKKYCSCIPINKISSELENYVSQHFNNKSSGSIMNQYSHIKNINKLYKPNTNNPIKKYEDNELERVLKIIKKKYEE